MVHRSQVDKMIKFVQGAILTNLYGQVSENLKKGESTDGGVCKKGL